VPFPAGGSVDVTSRSLAQKLSEALGQQIVVENKSGAGGNIGMDALAKSAPDGYTIGMGALSTHAVNPSLYAKMPFDAPITPANAFFDATFGSQTSTYESAADLSAADIEQVGDLTADRAGGVWSVSPDRFTGTRLLHVAADGTTRVIIPAFERVGVQSESLNTDDEFALCDFDDSSYRTTLRWVDTRSQSGATRNVRSIDAARFRPADINGTRAFATGCYVARDGSVVATASVVLPVATGGEITKKFLVFRWRADGEPDNGFGSGGVIELEPRVEPRLILFNYVVGPTLSLVWIDGEGAISLMQEDHIYRPIGTNLFPLHKRIWVDKIAPSASSGRWEVSGRDHLFSLNTAVTMPSEIDDPKAQIVVGDEILFLSQPVSATVASSVIVFRVRLSSQPRDVVIQRIPAPIAKRPYEWTKLVKSGPHVLLVGGVGVPDLSRFDSSFPFTFAAQPTLWIKRIDAVGNAYDVAGGLAVNFTPRFATAPDGRLFIGGAFVANDGKRVTHAIARVAHDDLVLTHTSEFKDARRGSYFFTSSVNETETVWEWIRSGALAYWRGARHEPNAQSFKLWPTDAAFNGVSICRFFVPTLLTHFYTADANECAALFTGDNKRIFVPEPLPVRSALPSATTGACAAGQTPVYRLFNPALPNHRWVTLQSERTRLASSGWIDEGTRFCAAV
jgi:Tripartite tricarboxylate transporter family receptor/Repeat of unknown function (DUF5648)